jgi:deoxycytidylate deaminase
VFATKRFETYPSRGAIACHSGRDNLSANCRVSAGIIVALMPYTAAAEEFMRLAIGQANRGNHAPGAGEVGCVITKDGSVVAQGHTEIDLRLDPTARAEIVAEGLRKAKCHGSARLHSLLHS